MLSATRLSFIFVAGALAVNQDLFAPAFPVVAYELAAVSIILKRYTYGLEAD